MTTISNIKGLTQSQINKVSVVLLSNIKKINDISLQAAFSSYSVALDGSGDYVNLGQASSGVYPSFFPTTVADWTLSFWIYWPGTSFGGIRGLFGRTKNIAKDYFTLRILSSGRLDFEKDISNYLQARNTASNNPFFRMPSDSATWIHVGITNDVSDNSAGFKFYKNGSVHTSLPSYAITNVDNGLTGEPLRIGKWGYNNATIGQAVEFDDVAIHHAALDSANINAIYNSGSPIDLTSDSGNYNQSSSLAYYWKFENNGTETVTGSTANSATPVNASYSSSNPAGS
jgi:hypothetical protein